MSVKSKNPLRIKHLGASGCLGRFHVVLDYSRIVEYGLE
jgi:hypothetical protein